MSWFSSDSAVTVNNDLDVHNITLYVLFGLLVLVLVMFYAVRKCRKMHKLLKEANRA